MNPSSDTFTTTRRGFVQACAAVVAALTAHRPARYGAVDMPRHRELQRRGIDLHVIVTATGDDITPDCYFADDTGAGYALTFRRNADGHKYLDPETHQAARQQIDGITFQRVR